MLKIVWMTVYSCGNRYKGRLHEKYQKQLIKAEMIIFEKNLKVRDVL